MLFVVIEKTLDSVPMKETLRTVIKAYKYYEGLKAKGKVIGNYPIAAKRGGIRIFDVESNDELSTIIARNPMYPYMTREIIPVVTPEFTEELLEGMEREYQELY